MKRILLLLPLLALASCSYPSKYEAEFACDEWKFSQYKRKDKTQNNEEKDYHYLCEPESETKQIIGIRFTGNSGKYVGHRTDDYQIWALKRFRY